MAAEGGRVGRSAVQSRRHAAAVDGREVPSGGGAVPGVVLMVAGAVVT